MEVKELRIGNWVHIPKTDQTAIVHAINFVGGIGVNKDAIGLGGLSVNKIEPIPLTEQWLKEFGFEKIIEDDAFFKEPLWLEENSGGVGVWKGFEGNHYLRHIGNVHQLQNLFYAISGKELERKSTTIKT